MEFKEIAARIIALAAQDLALRAKLIEAGQLGNGYHEEMQQLHYQNAEQLDEIISTTGFPTIEQVGEEASEAAWLIIQHSIAQPAFMRKCAKLMEAAVKEKKASRIHLAYLVDRIAVFEERPQIYGTQFDWDEQGQMSPQYFENETEVNEQRKSIGLNTLDEQVKIMRARAKLENESPPADFEKRKKELAEWRRSVGWVK